MIPKTIHYCWFGGKPLPEDVRDYIDTWRRHCPDYEIKEWNESNFDLDLYPFVRQAYDAKKFAFVADVVRLYALFHEGGIYMDTDVEVLKSFDPFLGHTAFGGYEDDTRVTTGVMGAVKGSEWARENLDYYRGRRFLLPDGSPDTTINVEIITAAMEKKGLRRDNTFQDFKDWFTIYPKDYFCPKSHVDGRVRVTPNTVVIHHFAGTWLSPLEAESIRIARRLSWIPEHRRYLVSKFFATLRMEGIRATLAQTVRRLRR
ncbi:MAG: glycosyl transferase [Duncaniella sp.]|nr:glycosyl transferase [Duncaniella sp.]